MITTPRLMRALVSSLALSALLPSVVAAAELDGILAKGADALLVEADKRQYGQSTQHWTFRMTVKAPGSEPRPVELEVWQKDRVKRLVRFTAPGEVKGLAMLSDGPSAMYVYSPQTDNVRRVAAHAERQTLLGSNFGYSDMAATDLSLLYRAEVGEATGTHQWLVLTKKDGADAEWQKLKVRIDKDKVMIDRIEYLEGDKVVRVQERTGFEVIGNYGAYRKVSMKTLGSGLETTMEMLSQEIGIPLDDGIFKKRNLVRGP